MRRFPAAALLSILLAAAGCDADTVNTMLYEYRDDPYMADIAGRGEAEILRGINSDSAEERMMALRIAAAQAGRLRPRGEDAAARELDGIIIRRYAVEREQEVRACIVRICAPATGRSGAMVRFLRERIAAGEFPGHAALSLAAMAPKSAFADIELLTGHPDPNVRLQAATALTVLGDPRGYAAVARVWRGMEQGLWPEENDGVTRAEARDNLAAQAKRAFGKELR